MFVFHRLHGYCTNHVLCNKNKLHFRYTYTRTLSALHATTYLQFSLGWTVLFWKVHFWGVHCGRLSVGAGLTHTPGKWQGISLRNHLHTCSTSRIFGGMMCTCCCVLACFEWTKINLLWNAKILTSMSADSMSSHPLLFFITQHARRYTVTAQSSPSPAPPSCGLSIYW